MSNCCCTNVQINPGNSEIGLKEARELYDKLLALNETPWDGKEDTRRWHPLANIAIGLGIAKKTDEGHIGSPVCLRGNICDLNMDDAGEITISQDDAWTPNVKIWEKVANTYAPHCEVYYNCEEPGCDVFWTNDPDVLNEQPYYVDIWEGKNGVPEDTHYCGKAACMKILQKFTGNPSSDIEILVQAAEELDGISVHSYRYVPISAT